MPKPKDDQQLPFLDTFAKTAELGSFTAAGAALGMTQAAVSQRIQALEKTLSVALFERKGGRIVLSEAGQQLYPFAQRILALHAEAIDAIAGKKTPVSGELSLAASSIPGEHLLPGILKKFQEQFPRIRVRGTVLDSEAALDLVASGKSHLGLVGRKDNRTDLEFRPFARDEMVLVVPGDHPWQRRREISLEELAKQPLVIREPGSGSRWCLEQALAAHDYRLGDLHVALELGSNEAIKEAVHAGLGVAVLSTLAVQKEMHNSHLRGLKIKDLALERTMYIVKTKKQALPPAAGVFVRFLESTTSA
ncbi:MAG: selenium metabolism-associated LysR family transcriptional regulator [Gemmataceae bacterium]